LQIAIKALGISKEIITTPFSYVASTSAIVWEGCKPQYVDIDPCTLCIDSDKIERAITEKTRAILAVHVYGNTCEVEKIARIAKKYNLKIIYDAAHAFGVKYKNISVLNYGDISTLSFHATKLFHTVEGGAVITNDDGLAHKISYLRNFGHRGPEDFWGLGINGKNSEFHAAMGLCILPKVKDFIKRRKIICETYSALFTRTPLRTITIHPKAEYNFAYYPLIFPSEKLLLAVRGHLNKHGIFPRRYFYPSLNKLNYVNKNKVPIAEDISRRILCLPLYPGLPLKDIESIARLIKERF
jgi:dTDP-4-amino-4,6-dideoxygalactose transaminase